MTPPLRQRVREISWTRSALWRDGELLCHAIGDALDDLSTKFHQLGGRCYRNAKAAKEAQR